MFRPIRLVGVKQNNLKNITTEFPARKISVITGLSGSGKSSLAFDTLYAEGQRRYVESLSTYTRQFLEKMPKPDLDSIENIPPAIALEQKNPILNSRSTVGTQTEIVDYLRVLFAKIGKTSCLSCGNPVRRLDAQSMLEWATNWLPTRKALILAPIQTTSPTPDQKANPSSRSSKKSASQKSKSPKPAGASLAQILPLLQEQGFQRILIKPLEKKSNHPKVWEIEELLQDTSSLANLSKKTHPIEAFVVVDRLRISETPDTDTRGRILDSIEQALAIGKGKIVFFDMDESTDRWQELDDRFACIQCGREHRIPEPHLFSFNSPIGACSNCSGFGHTLDLDESLIVPDPSKTLKNGAIDPFSKPSLSDWQNDLFRFAERQGISVGKRYRELTPAQRKLLWNGSPNDKTFPGIHACFEELKRWKYKIHIRVFIRRYQTQLLCSVCQGSRLKPEALAVKVGNYSISDILGSSIIDAHQWIQKLKLSATDQKIALEVLTQVERRLRFLQDVGVGYLTLSRLTKTLSGGEFQRINLATQLGNGLCGTLYVLDEPSIGLHAADTDRLIRVLKDLRDQGNSVVIVEHDLEIMRAADWLVELGPAAGRRGGELICQGDAHTLMTHPGSLTGKYLSGDFHLESKRAQRPSSHKILKITGCQEHNLKDIDVEFPLHRFVVVTGVSGSGKSTLVHRTLYRALNNLFNPTSAHDEENVGRFDKLYGAEQINGVVLLDQSPIGKNSRSNPATYLKAWDEIRKILANQVISLRRGYLPQHFSFNVDGGRCAVCKGEGEITLDMHFMAEVRLPCEECDGKRFKKSVLDVTYRGKNVHQLLQTTIDEAFELFRDNSLLARKLSILRDVGLGYLHLGQSATTLSGGESQRLKIAAVLDDREAENQLYIFDEPTTGLHLEDIRKLLGVIQDLIDSGHSVVMIEHHLDVIAQADWVIDLGPGGGTEGGHLIAAGHPSRLIDSGTSVTGKSLRDQGYEARFKKSGSTGTSVDASK